MFDHATDPADPSILTPVSVCAPVPRLSKMAVVPIYTVEFPSTAEGMVPDKSPAPNVADINRLPSPRRY